MPQQRRSRRAQPPPRRAARASASSLLHGSRLRRGSARARLRHSAVASRYCVVDPRLDGEVEGAGGARSTRSCFHGVPALDLCTTAPRTPRTTPLNVTLVPGATAGFGDGGCEREDADAEPRRPEASAAAAVAPPTPAVSCGPARERRDLERLHAARRVALDGRVDDAAGDAQRAPERLPGHRHRPPVVVRRDRVVRDRAPRRDTAGPARRTRRRRLRPAAGARGEEGQATSPL